MNKLALITGGHHSLGLAISTIFASHNYDLIITYYQNEEKALTTKEELEKKYNISVTLKQLDFQNLESLTNFTEELNKSNIKIDVLINNAALTIEKEFEDKIVLDFERILKVNTIAPYLLAKNLSNLMPAGSAIINVASTNGIDTYSPLTLEYDASKSALISITHNLATYLGPKIRVNAIAPGWINTESTKEMSPIYKEEQLKSIISQRFAEPEEIAETIYFLASPKASYINNSIIRIDGGLYVTR